MTLSAIKTWLVTPIGQNVPKARVAAATRHTKPATLSPAAQAVRSEWEGVSRDEARSMRGVMTTF